MKKGEGRSDILELVQKAATERILFLPHAVRQMPHPERMISPEEVQHVVMTGEVIEDYSTDPRGQSCLLLGFGEGHRPIHVVCAPKREYLAIITAYLPDPAQWSSDFTRRR